MLCGELKNEWIGEVCDDDSTVVLEDLNVAEVVRTQR
jgi:hypothetical protein